MIGISQEIGILDVSGYLLPRRTMSTWDWICEHIRTKDGHPFNALDYPWGKGICDAWDDPNIRNIYLQTSARIGKTTLAASIMISAIERDPRPAMIGQPTETLLKEQVRDRYYPMFVNCAPTRSWVPPIHKRRQHRIDLERGLIYGAWSGSESALSDKDPVYKHGGEIDKWTSNASDEADPLYLFMERGAEIPDRKTMLESTPTIANKSRINRGLQNGSNCRFHVPCPHCGTYQQMVLGDGTGGGIIWDKDEEGNSDPTLAYKTARYRCEKCKKEIADDQRRQMMLKGVWCPLGQKVDRRGRLRGVQANQTPDASFQLSRLYSPTFTFGDIAQEFVISHPDMGRFRNFLNSWMGEVWFPRKIDEDWEEIGKRMAGEHDVGELPDDHQVNFITVGVDVQVDHFVYTTVGWGHAGQGWLVDYGTLPVWNDVGNMIRRDYGGLSPAFVLIDARDGNRTDEVIEFCRSINKPTGPWVWPSMGTATTAMSQKPFIRQKLTAENQVKRSFRKGLQDVEVVKISTNYYQSWIQNCLERRKPGDDNSLALCLEASTDQDFLEQLLNEQIDTSETATGHDKLMWVKVSSHIPIDFRDALRYARCGADVYLNTNWQRVPKRTVVTPRESEGTSTPAAKPKSKKQATQESPARPKPVVPKERRSSWLGKGGRNAFLRK